MKITHYFSKLFTSLLTRNAAASSRPGLEDERQGLLQLILRGREAPIDARAAHRVQFRGEFLDLFILGLSISGIFFSEFA